MNVTSPEHRDVWALEPSGNTISANDPPDTSAPGGLLLGRLGAGHAGAAACRDQKSSVSDSIVAFHSSRFSR